MPFRFGGTTMSEVGYEWMALDSPVVMSWMGAWMAGVDCLISSDESDVLRLQVQFFALDLRVSTREMSQS